MRDRLRRLRFSQRRALAMMIVVATVTLHPAGTASCQAAPPSRGAALFGAGDYAGAQRELEADLRRNEKDAAALYYMGRIALQQQRSSAAVDWFEKAIAVDDGNAEYHVWLGTALGEETQRASKFRQPFLARRLKSEFERAVSLDPRNVLAHYGLIQVYALLPGFMGGDMAKAHQQATELAALSPLHGHLAAGFLAQREKNFPLAEREYEGAISSAPDSTAGYLGLGALQQRLERWTDAFATYDRLLARRAEESSALFQIGRIAALSGQNLVRGEQSLKRWLAKPPKDAPVATMAGAHHRLGQIYARTSRRDAARAEYEEALRLNPKNEDARKSLAELTAAP
jgi:tetratricopeptide (TPR) repeat protein